MAEILRSSSQQRVEPFGVRRQSYSLDTAFDPIGK
jgi:hypothetical protein